MSRVIEFAISDPSPSVVVDDVAPFVDLEHCLEFAVDDYVNRLCQRCCKVYLDTFAISYPSPSVVVDDVATFVDLEHCLEFAVDDYVNRLCQRGCKVYLDAEVTFSHQVETATIAAVRCQVEPDERVTIAKVTARQCVTFVLCLFTGGGEQVNVASNVAPFLKVWLEWFGWHLTSVEVDSQKVNGIVLCVEWVFRVFSIVGVVVDTPQDKSFWKRPEEEVLVCVRHCTLRGGIDLAVHGS